MRSTHYGAWFATRAFNIAPIMRRSEPLVNGAAHALFLWACASKQWRIIWCYVTCPVKSPLGVGGLLVN